jgi:hypothetical protein
MLITKYQNTSKKNKINLFVNLLLDSAFVIFIYVNEMNLLLFFLYSPLIFLLFYMFMRNSTRFITIWNGKIFITIKILLLFIILLIFMRSGHFIISDDLLVKKALGIGEIYQIAWYEMLGLTTTRVLIQIGFVISLIYNIMQINNILFFGQIKPIILNFRTAVWIAVLLILFLIIIPLLY